MNRRMVILSIVLTIAAVGQLVLSPILYNPQGSALLRNIGWVTLWVSAVFGWLPIFTFRRWGGVPKGQQYVKTTVLVDRGIYAIVRHPQYLAGVLLAVALSLIAQHWAIVVLGIPVVLTLYASTYDEEESSLARFGDTYRLYAERVPRLNALLGTVRLMRRLWHASSGTSYREGMNMATHEDTHWNDERARSYSRWSGLSSRLVYAPFARKIVGSVGPLADGATIVDLGTGPGSLAIELHRLYPQATIIGVDPSSAMLSIAQENAAKAGISRFETRSGTAEQIPVDDGSVDMIVCQSSFHEWQSQQKGLAEIHRVLKTGGSVVVRDYDRAWLAGWKAALFGLFHHLEMFRFTHEDAAELLREAGFTAVASQHGGMQYYIQAVKASFED